MINRRQHRTSHRLTLPQNLLLLCLLLGNPMIGEPTYSRIATMAKRNISAVDKRIPIFLTYCKHGWKPEGLRNHLRYTLNEIDRISDRTSPLPACPDGARLQGLDGTMS